MILVVKNIHSDAPDSAQVGGDIQSDCMKLFIFFNNLVDCNVCTQMENILMMSVSSHAQYSFTK